MIKPKVLVIDNDPASGELIGEAVGLEEHDLRLASDFQEGFLIFNEAAF